jgi:adenosylcobinamide kinase/adenosylcobinamide-phosphate guanylyltransferase
VLDGLGAPAQLGALRHRGLAGPGTTVALLSADHRIGSEQELSRRAGLWRTVVPADGDVLSTAAAPAGQRGGQPAWRPLRTLILGGARSGKSREAELRLAAEPDVTYLAAGPWADDAWTGADGRPDHEWARRVAAHQARRPSWWQTIEGPDVAGALRRLDGAVLIDGIGTWLAAVMDQAGFWAAGQDPARAAARLTEHADELVTAWRETSATVVAVSDEVGSGVVPATPAGRQFRDQLGWLNQRLAAESEQALLVIAGRVLDLPT